MRGPRPGGMLEGWIDLTKGLRRFLGKCCVVALVAIATYSIWMKYLFG